MLLCLERVGSDHLGPKFLGNAFPKIFVISRLQFSEMKFHILFGAIWLLLGMLTLTGCGSKEPTSNGVQSDSTAHPVTTDFCGEAELLNINGEDDRSIGVLELQNDAEFLWITLNPASGMKLQSLSAFVGDYHQCPRKVTGANDYDEFPIQVSEFAQGGAWAARIPLVQLEACTFTALKFSVQTPKGTSIGELLSGKGGHVTPGIEFCIRQCNQRVSNCSLDDPQKLPRTVPQTEWLKDGNLRTQLEEAFAARYPNGLTIGCNQQIRFATAADILGSLPMTGKPLPLTATESEVKPGMVNNQLAGELITLDLAIQLDAHSENFSNGDVPLYVLQVTRGAFEGWTLAELQQEGNSVLGACTSNFTPEQITEVLQGINANFAKGNPVGDYLSCKLD